MNEHSYMVGSNDENDCWNSYVVADLYSKAGAAWVPVFEALVPELTGLDNLVLGIAIRSAKGGRKLDMKASEIAGRIGVTRGAVQQCASRLVGLGLLRAEPQRVERVKVVNGREMVTTERLPTVYSPVVPAIARAIGLPAKPSSAAGRKAPAHKAPTVAIGPDAPAAARAAGTHAEDVDDAYARFCSAFNGKPGKKNDETRREWDTLVGMGYPLNRLAELGERYMAVNLGEIEKARYPLTFLRNKDLVRALLGKAPRNDRYLIENWGTPLVSGEYWFISPVPVSGLRDKLCLGDARDFPSDADEVRRAFAAGLADARAKHAPLDSINYPSFVVKTDSPGAKNPA